MKNKLSENRLHQHMAQLVVLESNIEKMLEQQSKSVTDYPDGAATIQNFRQLSQTHRQALEARLNTVSDNVSVMQRTDEEFQFNYAYPMSTSLRLAYRSLNEAIIDYTTLRILALRFRDSIMSGEENTADLASQHMRDYIGAVQKISQLLHDVVVWELEQEGHSCDCNCACCGLGICICARNNRKTLSDAWGEAGQIAEDVEVTVLPLRPDSNAAKAGLLPGEIIVAVDGQELQIYENFYGTIEEHKPGEIIELRVRRESGELTDIPVIRQ